MLQFKKQKEDNKILLHSQNNKKINEFLFIINLLYK